MLADVGSSTEPVIKYEHEWIPRNMELACLLRKDLMKGASYATWLAFIKQLDRS